MWSISSHFVRRYTSHLSKTISCFFRRYDYITITCTLTAALMIIILTILAHLCLFLIISHHGSCNTAQLPLWSQFSCSFTPTRLCLYSLNTSPLWIFYFSHTCGSTVGEYVTWAIFCFCWNFSDMSLIHSKFLLVFQMPPPNVSERVGCSPQWYWLEHNVTWLNLVL